MHFKADENETQENRVIEFLGEVGKNRIFKCGNLNEGKINF